jgi:hypothetical protein
MHFGGSLGPRSPRVCEDIAENVLALQLFNGETDFEQQVSQCSVESHANDAVERDKKRKRSLVWFLFEGTTCAQQAGEVMAGAEQLVKARRRGAYWEGSSLQEVCREETEKLQFIAPQVLS